MDLNHETGQPTPLHSGSNKIDLTKLRVAIVHYWFVGRAGGEKVVEALAEIFPQADLYALVAERSVLAPELAERTLHTSFLQHMPGARRYHRHFLLLQPLALEQFDLSQYDLVISSESGPAKGVITPASTCHICYCHSPMRYIWDMYPQYKRRMNPLVRAVFSVVAHYIRLWDLASAQRVDYFVANSRFIASRIRRLYGRDSTVIHPPVEVAAGSSSTERSNAYLAVGRLVDYKRFDIAVQACTALGKPLTIIGDGPERKRLEALAGPTIRFLGRLSDERLREQLAQARALLFPGEEDFGIVPVEAQSFGRPVVAYGFGGALETVRGNLPGKPPIENPTGIFFYEQTAEGMRNAILEFEAMESGFSPEQIREHAWQFDRQIFKSRMALFVRSVLADRLARNAQLVKS
jgi:glycosyltransferase involved in cell wall biosynthesis